MRPTIAKTLLASIPSLSALALLGLAGALNGVATAAVVNLQTNGSTTSFCTYTELRVDAATGDVTVTCAGGGGGGTTPAAGEFQFSPTSGSANTTTTGTVGRTITVQRVGYVAGDGISASASVDYACSKDPSTSTYGFTEITATALNFTGTSGTTESKAFTLDLPALGSLSSAVVKCTLSNARAGTGTAPTIKEAAKTYTLTVLPPSTANCTPGTPTFTGDLTESLRAVVTMKQGQVAALRIPATRTLLENEKPVLYTGQTLQYSSPTAGFLGPSGHTMYISECPGNFSTPPTGASASLCSVSTLKPGSLRRTSTTSTTVCRLADTNKTYFLNIRYDSCPVTEFNKEGVCSGYIDVAPQP